MGIQLDGLAPLIQVFDMPRSVAFYDAYLRGKGVRIEPPVIAPYGMKQLHLADPDGYAICLQTRVRQ